MELLLVIGLPVLLMLCVWRVFLKALRWVAGVCGVFALVIVLTTAFLLLDSDSKGVTEKEADTRARHVYALKLNSGLALGSFALIFFTFRLRPAGRVVVRYGQHQFKRNIPFSKANNDSGNPFRIDVKQGLNGALVLRLQCNSQSTDEQSSDDQSALLCVEAEAAQGCPFVTKSFCDDSMPREIRFMQTVSVSKTRQEYTVSLDELGIYPFKGSEVELKVYATLSRNRVLLAQTPITAKQLSPVLDRPALLRPPQQPAQELPKRLARWAKLKRVDISPEARRARKLLVSELFTGTASTSLSGVRLQIVVRNVEKIVEEIGVRLRAPIRKHLAFRDAVVYETVIDHIAPDVPIEEGLNAVLTFETLFSQHYPPATVIYADRALIACGLGLELEVRLSHPKQGMVVSQPVARTHVLKTDLEEFEFTDVRGEEKEALVL